MDLPCVANETKTSYQRDYVAKERGLQCRERKQNVRSTDPFQEPGNAGDRDSISLCNEYLETTFKKEYPKLAKKHMQTPVSDSLKRDHVKCSEYSRQYCDCKRGIGRASDSTGYRFTCVEPKQTSYSDFFRPPPEVHPHIPIKPEIASLARSHDLIMKILKPSITSEYRAEISEHGRLIIENAMLGDLHHNDPLDS